jgi:hypothetical protein
MFIDRSLDRVDIEGDRELLKRLVEVAPPNINAPVSA